jgi:predicted RNA methylase
LREAAHGLDYRLSATDVAALLVDSLTCLFVEDKFQVDYDSAAWWQEVETRFTHLREHIESYDDTKRALLDFARQFLREGINYRSLDSVVIADLYEPRLVDAGADNENGIVYTPYDLASRIMDRVPVELLEPHERQVLDFACGSGTLLLAAHERLHDAYPYTTSPSRMHDYLVGSLEGWDLDPFAVQLTHLSLTLRGDPLGNGWNVSEANTLKKTPTQRNIVVANPPWGGRRSGSSNRASEKARDDAVTPFISWAMNSTSPDGFMALFLPASWLTARHSSDMRRRFTRDFDLLEVWRLPEETFRGADVKGAAVIARRRSNSKSAVRPTSYITHRIPTKLALDQFVESGAAQETSLSKRPVAGEPLGAGSAIGEYVRANDQRLDDVFSIRSGPTKGRGSAGGNFYRWLGSVREMKHFGGVTAANTTPAMYPRDFDKGASWSPDKHYATKKLLVTRVRRSGNPWRVKVGFAFEPVIPSNNQYALVVSEPDFWKTDEEDLLFAAGALLGSAPISLFIDDLVATGNIPRDVLGDIRLPEGWLGLAEKGRRLHELVARPSERAVLLDLLREVDDDVIRLFGIPRDVWDVSRARLEDELAPEEVVRYRRVDRSLEQQVSEDPIWRDGVVLDLTPDRVRIWVDEYTPEDGVEVRVPPRLPAATFLPGVTFVASGLNSDPGGGFFRLHKSNFEESLLPEEPVRVAEG